MADVYVDANVLLRFFTQDPPGLWERAQATLAAAARGEVRLILTPVILAEVVWTLRSFYGHGRIQIADQLLSFVTADGLVVWDKDAIMRALSIYRDRNLDFADALLAAYALVAGPPQVCTFDRDFRRIAGLSLLEPGSTAEPPRGEPGREHSDPN
ncbi:MAG: PIN domain-containing protein [Chloroflexi bacterium]|nr:PIN domain-containing protein [Chloroflexota bacterium]